MLRGMSEERSGELAGLRVALVGPGRVGTSLVHWVRACGARVEMVAGRTERSREGVAAAVEARPVPLGELSSGTCDLLLVAVSDAALDGVARELALRPQAAVVLHTAGARGASALSPLPRATAGAFHPLKAFPAPLPELGEAAGTFFALDGPPDALALGRRLARAFGGSAEVVTEAERPLYHLAASVAAGGVATLVASAVSLAGELGLPAAVGRGYLRLASGALDRLAPATDRSAGADRVSTPTLGGAITGPVARGDFTTFARQMEALDAAGPSGRRRLDLFVTLALETVRLAAAERTDREADEASQRLRRALREAGVARTWEPSEGSDGETTPG